MAVKLVEMGPRLCLRLCKVERGLASGNVMHNAYVNKTPKEVRKLKKKRRREEQEANVARKREAVEKKKAERERRRKERPPASSP